MSGQGRQFRRALRATGAARQAAEAIRAQAAAATVEAEIRAEAYETKLADLHRLQNEFETWLATLPELKNGDEVFVPSLNKTARLVRLELHRQIALVDSSNMQVEVPLRELMPDLGQSAVREQIASLQKQILEQARQSEQMRAESERLKQEYQRSLQQQKELTRQYEAWLSAVRGMKVGDEVPIAHKAGRGKLLKVNMDSLRAVVATEEGEIELPLQDLFPQTGPFAPPPPPPLHKRLQKGIRAAAPVQDRPMQRRSRQDKAAKSNRELLLAVQPGAKVYVVPFNKPATLIRIKADKDLAVVQSGAFEMELPLADLEPMRQQ